MRALTHTTASNNRGRRADDSMADLVDLGSQLSPSPTSSSSVATSTWPTIPAANTASCGAASLRSAGVKVALSTDMPFGDGDPWASMRPQFAAPLQPARYSVPTKMCLGA